jgi:hypothetical protein
VVVTDEAFDELLDRLHEVDRHESADEEEVEMRRRQFALAVARAMKNVVSKKDRRLWYTQTLRRHGCRLHFVRSDGRIHLIACMSLDGDDEEGYST